MVVNCLTQSKYRTQCERRKNEWASSISTYSSVRYLSTSGARLQLCQICPDPRTRFPLDWRFESVHKYLHHVSHRDRTLVLIFRAEYAATGKLTVTMTWQLWRKPRKCFSVSYSSTFGLPWFPRTNEPLTMSLTQSIPTLARMCLLSSFTLKGTACRYNMWEATSMCCWWAFM